MTKSELRQLIREQVYTILTEFGRMDDEERTPEEIESEIQALEDERGRVPEFSPQGEENWVMIDAMISVLRKEKTPADFPHRDASEDEYGIDPVSEAAQQAYEWLVGIKDTIDEL